MGFGNMTKMFSITSVCRADVLQAFNDVGELDDDLEQKIKNIKDYEMKYLASKMADDYCNQLYWESLRVIFGELFLKKQ